MKTNNSKTRKRFSVSKWIMLSLAILTNSFIIFYSSIDQSTSNNWNRSLTNFFTSFINSFSNKTVDIIPLENIEIRMSSKDDHKYNDIPGYELNEIPLGSAKQIDCSFFPEDSTDKGIVYTASPADCVSLNQSGPTLSVVGMKTGDCVITAKSNSGDFESKVDIKIVDTVAPVSYEISLDNVDIPLGTTQTIKFDIDGGVLTHDELINFRYYNIKELTFLSSNNGVATVDKHGVIHPVSIGDSTISVSNGKIVKAVDIHVSDGVAPTPYSNLSIGGSNTCYANDMLLDQSSKKNHYQLTPFDGEIELDPEDFVWESSNDLLVRVDTHGVMRGFRKSTIEDEFAIITATSKATSQSVSFEVVVKNQIPQKLNYYLIISEKEVWNEKEYTVFVGNIYEIKLYYDIYSISPQVEIECTDNNILSCVNEGKQINMNVLSEGTAEVTIASKNNPELICKINFVAIKDGAISNDNISGVGYSLRKSVGHAAVFMVAQIFTLLAFFMFYPERKWYVWTSMSLGEGLFISGLSELIQFFVPSRSGAWLDVLIDFSGVVVGAALALLGIFIVKKIIAKRRAKQVESK